MALLGNSLWQLVAQSDAITKAVLVILCGMSTACWTVVLYKIMLLWSKKRKMALANMRIKEVHNIDDVVSVAASCGDSLPGFALSRALNMIKSLSVSGTYVVSARSWQILNEGMGGIVDAVVHREESYLGVLSTSAAVSPLLGLFGTVWGLIHAFIDISHKQAADIAVVAPGIAEALITTLAGLLVAIPAAMMYHYFVLSARSFESQVSVLLERVMMLVHIQSERSFENDMIGMHDKSFNQPNSQARMHNELGA
jgi:biopolymer transport protein TolQ